jgi:hypothetical protein
MIKRLPIDLIVEIGILAGPDEYEELAKTSERNAIILHKPYIIKAMSEFIRKVVQPNIVEFHYNTKPHSFNDHPAIIRESGAKEWCRHGKTHRDNDQPAVIENGTEYWYQYGKIHRDNDQPAVIYSDGTKSWWQYGQRHRDNDQPAVIYPDGHREWYQHGKNHRDNDQPAVICSHGTTMWYQHGKRIK